eukprot:Gb_01045 [translate_table: standard]
MFVWGKDLCVLPWVTVLSKGFSRHILELEEFSVENVYEGSVHEHVLLLKIVCYMAIRNASTTGSLQCVRPWKVCAGQGKVELPWRTPIQTALMETRLWGLCVQRCWAPPNSSRKGIDGGEDYRSTSERL